MSIEASTTDKPRELRSEELRPVDRDLLCALRQLMSEECDSVGVGQLTESLGVTATAVRQRIERLLAMGLIDREKKTLSGRGRPTFRYRLTVTGHRAVGANATAIADAMWREILELDNSEVRQRLLSGIAKRLGRQYAADMDASKFANAAETVHARMSRLSETLAGRQVINQVNRSGDLPVLDIGACPYPTLTDASDDRSMCRLEEQMFSEALGQPVHLSSCRLDGDPCCQFSVAAAAESPASETTK